MKSIFSACQHSEHCKLAELDLEQTGLGPEAATDLGAALRSERCQLTHISLNRNDPGIGDQGSKSIAAALKSQQHSSSLLQLNLCRNDIGVSGAVSISEVVGIENSRLQRIWLLGNPFADTPEGAQMVASGFYGEIKLRYKESPLRELAGVDLWKGMVGVSKALSNRDMLLVLSGKKVIKTGKENHAKEPENASGGKENGAATLTGSGN